MRWHGLIRPVDDPVWDKIYPPNGWNCGCIVQQLTRSEAERRGITPKSESERIRRRTRAFRNKRTGEALRITDGVDPGFDFNIGKEHMRGAMQAVESSLATGDLSAAQTTLTNLVDGEGFTRFLADPVAFNFHPVMLIPESIRRRVGAQTPIVRLSADTLAKQREIHPDIVEADYRLLPLIAADPDLVIQDGERCLLLVRQGEDWLLAATKITQSGKAGFLTSFRRTKQADIDRILRRGGRVVLRKR